MSEEKFKPFWVVSVNNYLCDADYSGKALKAKHRFPSFRQFYFIKDWNDLNGFSTRKEITNREVVERALEANKQHA